MNSRHDFEPISALAERLWLEARAMHKPKPLLARKCRPGLGASLMAVNRVRTKARRIVLARA
jgi:hypothetical protein